MNYKKFCKDIQEARDTVGIAGYNDWQDWHRERKIAFQQWSVMALAVINEWDQREPRSLNTAFSLLAWIAMLPYDGQEAMLNSGRPDVPNILQSVKVASDYGMSKWTEKQLRTLLWEDVVTSCYGLNEWGSFEGSGAAYRVNLIHTVGRMIDLATNPHWNKKRKKAA